MSLNASLTRVSDTVLRTPPRHWWWAMLPALALSGVFVFAVGRLLASGVGIWGIDIPVAWGLAIANYIWWIGIGMAGTFISAALHLLRSDWRAPISRYAESMTVFAVAVSGFFPILHLGRPWFFYWLAPYPNAMALWPQWRSSLLWDFFAISAYLLVSILYWYLGLLPDLAALRDRARRRGQQVFYGLLALGWRGEARQWLAHGQLSTVLAGLAVPLVFSVHSMVALDLSEALLPGWHSTLLPPFFVIGALYSGFATALLLGVLVRAWLHLEAEITDLHLARLAQVLLAAGMFMAYCYALELLLPYYSGDRHEIALVRQRLAGPYAGWFWATLVLNIVPVQLAWSPRVRRNPALLCVIAACVVVGMWCERTMLLLTSLANGLLPSAAGHYTPTLWDWLTLAGSIGVFAFFYLLFLRLLPALSMHEMRRAAGEMP